MEMILNHLLEQLNELDEKYPTARVYIKADHGQMPEAMGAVEVILVENSSYYLSDDVEQYALADLDEDDIKSLVDEGYEYVVIIS